MRINRFVYLYSFFSISFSFINSTSMNFDVSQVETRLIRMLLNESIYLKKVRPSYQVIVDIRFLFNQIISMVEKEQIIVTNCFVDQKWIDHRLRWNPADFHNITWVRIPATSVWYPDTFLYNTADNAGFLLPQDTQNVMVSSNGTVFWPLPLAQLRTRCRMTIKHFPFDEQTCDMVFGSWSHTSSLVYYRFWEDKPELPQYIPNNEWKLLAVTQSIKTIDFPNWVERDPFFEINFTILIVRKPLQAIYNTVVPALMLTTLTLVSFFIPFAQEMQIGISIMLAYSVFSLRLSEDVPSQSDSVHLISLYLTVCMFFSLSAMTWFAVVNKLREKRRLPHWLRWFALNYISYIVLAKSMQRKALRTIKHERSKTPSIIPPTLEMIPLQQITTVPTEYSNNYYYDRESVLTGNPSSSKVPLLCRTQPSTDQSIGPISTSETHETTLSTTQTTASSIWVRRRLLGQLPPSPSSINGHSDRKRSHSSKPLIHSQRKKSSVDRSTNKNKESLYAIHIYNRLVFLMFFLVVIGINIYTWFFHSRMVRTKLLDDTISWSCFDESKLSIVNCSTQI